MIIYSRLITGSYRLTEAVGVGGKWLTSTCGWVRRGAAAAIVRCFLCCFEFKSLSGPGEAGKLMEQGLSHRTTHVLGIDILVPVVVVEAVLLSLGN